MNGDPNFADYNPPDRRLRDDEIDVDFIEAVLAVGAEFKLRGQGHTPAAAPAKTTHHEIPASTRIKALADRLRKETA